MCVNSAGRVNFGAFFMDFPVYWQPYLFFPGWACGDHHAESSSVQNPRLVPQQAEGRQGWQIQPGGWPAVKLWSSCVKLSPGLQDNTKHLNLYEQTTDPIDLKGITKMSLLNVWSQLQVKRKMIHWNTACWIMGNVVHPKPFTPPVWHLSQIVMFTLHAVLLLILADVSETPQ